MQSNYQDLSSVKKVLVIKLRHLGDVLLSTPVFGALKKALPDAQIDGYVWKEAAPMLSGNPATSQVVAHQREWKKLPLIQKLRKEMRLLRWIREQNYDLVINLTEGDRGAIATCISGAKIRVGIDPGKEGFLFKRKVYTHLVKPCLTPRHAVERDLDALRRIGIFPKPEEKGLYFHIPGQARTSALAILDSYGLKRGGYALIHGVSRWLFKCPPPSLWQEVIQLLKIPVILTGGPGEAERSYVEEIAAGEGRAINLAGKTNLKELGALMDMAQGVLTVDSVPLHMASALQAPVVVLFGPTSEVKWGPWMHPYSQVIAEGLPCRPCLMDGCGGSKRSECLFALSPEKIAQAFHEAVHKKGEQSLVSSFGQVGPNQS